MGRDFEISERQQPYIYTRARDIEGGGTRVSFLEAVKRFMPWSGTSSLWPALMLTNHEDENELRAHVKLGKVSCRLGKF